MMELLKVIGVSLGFIAMTVLITAFFLFLLLASPVTAALVILCLVYLALRYR